MKLESEGHCVANMEHVPATTVVLWLSRGQLQSART